ncbi:MAG: Isoprenyl transferase [bacterium P3]|nr:MAG: Isoprenyl transferase [bacterium P3]KWW41028.1 MAG: Isoprenyl transferase [bacterium F083]
MKLEDLDKNNMPHHVAVIMDGNGRWAKRRDRIRLFGHQNAITAVRNTVEAAVACGVQYLTLYTFSTENWNRPQDEVDGLMELLVKAIKDETKTMMDNNVRMRVIGDTDRLPLRSLQMLQQCMDDTSANTGTTVVLALSYSARWEMAQALRRFYDDVRDGHVRRDDIGEETLRGYLVTRDIPDPDLLIRTGGELRLSNFLLWQMAYTEFYFSEQLWPDFRHENFYEAIADYQRRQRRYGKTGDQIARK